MCQLTAPSIHGPGSAAAFVCRLGWWFVGGVGAEWRGHWMTSDSWVS